MSYNFKYTPLLLVLITVVVFSPTLFNDFQRGWDDGWILLDNPYVVETSFGSIQYHFTHFFVGQYSPINTLVYSFIYKLFGFNPMAYHIMCLIVHIINVCLVYVTIKRMVALLKPDFKSNRVHFYTFLVALIFAIHPLQVESVAWISASKILLYSFFTLLAIWCYTKYIESSKLIWYFAVFLCYALGFGSKEQAIILPLVLLIFDYAHGRLHINRPDPKIIYKRVFLEKIPLFFAALAFWYFSSINNTGVISIENTYPLYQRTWFGMHSVSEYIFRFLAPVKLYYYYFFPMEIGDKLPLYFWGYAILMLIIGGFIWGHYKKRNKLVIFGFLFFVVNIILVLHILPMPRKTITADRYMYLSIIGLSIILVWYIDYLYFNYRAFTKYMVVVVITYSIGLGTHTFFRTQEWKDSEHIKHNIKELIDRRKQFEKPIINNPLDNE